MSKEPERVLTETVQLCEIISQGISVAVFPTFWPQVFQNNCFPEISFFGGGKGGGRVMINLQHRKAMLNKCFRS